MFYKHVLKLVIVLVLSFTSFSFTSLVPAEKVHAAILGDTQWARSTTVAPNKSYFYDTTTDSAGNVYAVGYITGNSEYNFGNGVTVSGNYTNDNAVIVKYNSAGEAQWAKSAVVAPNTSFFYSTTTDSAGNIYAVGYIRSAGEYNFGNGVTASGNHTSNNTIIVKYNFSGEAQWAKSVVVAPNSSSFNAVTIDAADNIYAVGHIGGTSEYNFGNGVTVSGNYTMGNAVIVKYNSAGETQWAKSAVVAPNASFFYSTTTDSAGNVYTVGYINGTNEYNFGNGVTVSGNYAMGNTVIVKYNSSGTAQWAKSTTVALKNSRFQDVTVDIAGNIYAVGDIGGTDEYNFGNGVTVAGNHINNNAVIVKYNSTGETQWAKSVVVAPSASYFYNTTTDLVGNVYAVGYITGNSEYNFGNGVTVAGNNTDGNTVIVKYNSSGEAQWARSTVVAPNTSYFLGATTDSAGNIYAVGYIRSAGQFDFGNGVTTAGAYSGGDNALLVKYAGLSTDIVYQNLPGLDKPINIEDGDVITVPLFTIKVKPYSEVGISKVEFYVDDNLLCTSHTSDKDGVYSCKWDTTKYHSTVKVITYNAHGGTATLTRTASVSLTVLPKTGR